MHPSVPYWPPDKMAAIPLTAVHDFLARRGWVLKDTKRLGGTARYYEHSTWVYDDGEVMHYYFPNSEHYADYPLRVLDLIRAMGDIHDLPYDQVYRQLTRLARRPAKPPAAD